MTNFLRFAVGILASVIALLMYAAPIITFVRVIKKRSTENFSGFPYAIALFNCLVYTWYGSPLVSNGYDNIIVATVNAAGILLECFFICTFLILAPPYTKRIMVRMVVTVLALVATTVAVSLFALHDRKYRKLLVGSVGMVATVVLYGAPLSITRVVIKTKSVEFMPFYLSLFTFLSSCFWMAYGALGKDLVIMGPNFFGIPLGIAQMVVYFIYRGNRKSILTKDGKSNIDELDPEVGLKESGGVDGKDTHKTISPTVDQDVEMQKKEQGDKPSN